MTMDRGDWEKAEARGAQRRERAEAIERAAREFLAAHDALKAHYVAAPEDYDDAAWAMWRARKQEIGATKHAALATLRAALGDAGAER
jgi:hypothetical protein